MKTVTATKMKCAVVFILISLAFVSQAFAVLRPLFPIKPAAPFNGELIVIGDDLVLRSAPPPDYDAKRVLPCSYRAGNVIETREHKGDFVEP